MQHCHAGLFSDLPQGLPDVQHNRWLETLRGLIKKQQVGAADRRASDGQLLLLASKPAAPL